MTKNPKTKMPATRIQTLLKKARAGNIAAQYELGVCFEYGLDTAINIKEAYRWYRAAAIQGSKEAQFNLGYRYEHGIGVKQNFVEASRWYRKAANQELVEAQYNLGGLYSRGQGVVKSTIKARYWYKKCDNTFSAITEAIRWSIGGPNLREKLNFRDKAFQCIKMDQKPPIEILNILRTCKS